MPFSFFTSIRQCIFLIFHCMIEYLQHGESRSTDVAGPSSTADGSKNGFDFDGSKQDKRENAADNDRLSEIEQLLEGKSFSRYMVIDYIVYFP